MGYRVLDRAARSQPGTPGRVPNAHRRGGGMRNEGSDERATSRPPTLKEVDQIRWCSEAKRAARGRELKPSLR